MNKNSRTFDRGCRRTGLAASPLTPFPRSTVQTVDMFCFVGERSYTAAFP